MTKITGTELLKFSQSIWSYNRSLTGKGAFKTLKKVKYARRALQGFEEKILETLSVKN